jgi:hypothetical protein
MRIFAVGSRVARAPCGGPATGVAAALEAARSNGHTLWAAELEDGGPVVAEEGAVVLSCAACGIHALDQVDDKDCIHFDRIRSEDLVEHPHGTKQLEEH